MLKALLRELKRALTVLGGILTDRGLHRLQMLINYMRLGRWMADHGYRFKYRTPLRDGVFERMADDVADRRVLYLEFGVYQGSSMRWWSAALEDPRSQLHGFDSFEGLPEDYDDQGGRYVRGWFSTGGRLPLIDDPRVRFFKGWFEQTLPGYSLPEHDVLVVNLDADLYSSTIFVLRQLRPHLKPGTYLYLDDMSRPDHEPRALDEFLRESGIRLRPLAADVTLNNVCFVVE